MVYAAVVGKSGRLLCGELYAVLEKLCAVTLVDDTLLTAASKSPEVLLWQCGGSARINARGAVLVLDADCGDLSQLQVQPDCVVIADMANEDATEFAATRGLRLLDCGMSSKASLTFSSIGMGTGVISLQRGIFDLYGNNLEPFDMPLAVEPVPCYPVLAAVGVLLLAGKAALLETLHNI